MAKVDPIGRLYRDISTILKTITIKYNVIADGLETMEGRASANRYMLAMQHMDTFEMYHDYSIEEFHEAGVTDKKEIYAYMQDLDLIPPVIKAKLLSIRREREIKQYEEPNNYYRELNGLPPIEDTKEDFFYLPEELAKEYNIPMDLPVHKIGDEMGTYYSYTLESIGYFDKLYQENPTKKYLKYMGVRRISIYYARNAQNFSLLTVEQESVMESTYREFIRSYEKARIYFISTCYNYAFRKIIPNYDNFIALCIFLMAIQQVSIRAIQNAIDREFYDEYLVQLLYETYGLPYFSRIDENTQKRIVQNLNLLIQNKATDKVLLDIASILGFTDVTIYQYYLMKKQKFDKHGHPIIKRINRINADTGIMEEVYDYENMQSIYFQKVPIDTENIKKELTSSVNRVEYSEVTYYDPFWWEDNKLHQEIWETQYNYMESKYYGITIPYRLTDVLFQAIILLRVILDEKEKLGDIKLQLPLITDKMVSLPDVVILYFALMAKKMGLAGTILSTPSKIIHFLEVSHQCVRKETSNIEVLAFNFDAFSPKNISKLKELLETYFVHREYRVVNGHDIDLREDGTQDISGPTKKLQYTLNRDELEEFYSYVTMLTIPNASPSDKIKALNRIYENSRLLYDFLSYQMSTVNSVDEFEAIKILYDTAFYTTEIKDMFKIETEYGEQTAQTLDEYFKYTNMELYGFIQQVEKDQIYSYIDHIIYKMEEISLNVGELYMVNQGLSPLMELLEIMVKFFKSYVIDFVKLSTLMVMDWDIENIVRLYDDMAHITKVDMVESGLSISFSDVINKLKAKIQLTPEQLHFLEFIRIHADIRIDDQMTFYEELKYKKLVELDSEEERLGLYDVIRSAKVHMSYADQIKFFDKLKLHTKFRLKPEELFFYETLVRNKKTVMIDNDEDIMNPYDLIKIINATIRLDDQITLIDDCIKIKRKE